MEMIFFESHKIEPGKGIYTYFSKIGEIPQFKDAVFPFTLPLGHPNYRTPSNCISTCFNLDAPYKDIVSVVSYSTLAIFAYKGDDTESPIMLDKAPLFIYPVSGLPVFTKEREAFLAVEMIPIYKRFYIDICIEDDIDISKALGLTINLEAIIL